MSDNDLIRRGDALYAIAGWEIPSTAIAALPAVTVGMPCTWPSCGHTAKGQCQGTGVRTVSVGDAVAKVAIDRAIERLRSLPAHAGRPAWDAIVAEELNAALDLTPAPDPAAIREAALQQAVTAVRQALIDAAHAHRADKPTSSAMFKAETYATNAILALIPKGDDHV